MSIVDAQGAAVASYEYDPYGNLISSSGDMAAVNPLRYRGYYFDSESGLYYLQSRYYDPKIGRFRNADSYVSTGQGFIGCNMFAYCRNNPVCRVDISGAADMNCFDEVDDELDVTPGEDDLGYSSGKGFSNANPLASYMEHTNASYHSTQRGVGGSGWHGDSSWKQNVNAISNGGTHTSLKGGVPTQSQAMQLIAEAKGTYMRVETAHDAPNPHTFPHINYIVNGIKGTIHIAFAEQEGIITYDGYYWR